MKIMKWRDVEFRALLVSGGKRRFGILGVGEVRTSTMPRGGLSALLFWPTFFFFGQLAYITILHYITTNFLDGDEGNFSSPLYSQTFCQLLHTCLFNCKKES